MDYKSLTEKEIKQIADDFYRGVIFTNRHINNIDDVPRVFTPILFLEEGQIEEINKNPPGLIYEYMDQAGPMSINGMPIFLSMKMINQQDAKKVFEKYEQIKKAIEKI